MHEDDEDDLAIDDTKYVTDTMHIHFRFVPGDYNIVRDLTRHLIDVTDIDQVAQVQFESGDAR